MQVERAGLSRASSHHHQQHAGPPRAWGASWGAGGPPGGGGSKAAFGGASERRPRGRFTATYHRHCSIPIHSAPRSRQGSAARALRRAGVRRAQRPRHGGPWDTAAAAGGCFLLKERPRRPPRLGVRRSAQR